MFWAPLSLQHVINFSLEIKKSTETDATKIKKLDTNIALLESRIQSQEISPRELKICRQLVDKNLSLINDVTDIKNVHFKEVQSRVIALFDLISQTAKAQLQAESPSSAIPAPTPKPEPVLNLVFLCDIDAEDYNSAIMKGIKRALSETVPFVASKSLINGSDLEEGKKDVGRDIKDAIPREYQDWNIFIKGELVVFIPKAYPFTAEELGFDLDTVQPIQNLNQLFQGPTGKPKIEDFISLFKPESHVKKRVILNGHGNIGFIGGLSLEHYRQFLQFLKDSGGESLEIQSCHAGSINVIEHYYEIERPVETYELDKPDATMTKPQIQIPDVKKETQKEKIVPTFPISMRSIGSFSTFSTAHADTYKTYFENIDTWLKEKGAATVPKFQKMLREISKKRTTLPDNFVNYMQVKFPHQLDTPGGFRPLGEDPSTQIITYTNMKVAEIEHAQEIKVDNKKFLEILPLVVNVPVNITHSPTIAITVKYEGTSLMVSDSPVLLSMIPGDAHHLIHEMKAGGFTLIDLFVTNANIYKESSADKAFFIGNMQIKKSVYSKVVLEFSEKKANLYFAEGEPELYFHYQLDIPTKTLTKTPITPAEFCFAIIQAGKRTELNSEALRSSSGGQEGVELFWKDLLEHSFWEGEKGAHHPLPSDYVHYDHYRQSPPKLKVEELFKVIQPASHQSILMDAIRNGDNELAALLLHSGTVDVNKKSDAGRTLLYLAILNKNEEGVRMLLEKGADLNAPSLNNQRTPLMMAVQSGKGKILDLLLEKSLTIDFDAKDSRGWTALQLCHDPDVEFKKVYEALKNQLIEKDKLEGLELETALKERLNHTTNRGFTMLSYATMMGYKTELEALLKLGADPYLGKPSSLSQAICERNKDMVDFWLQKNVDATKPDSEGKTALEYACLRGTPEILALLLKNTDLSTYPQPLKLFEETLKQTHLANAKLLLDAGLNIAAKDANDFSFWLLLLFRYSDDKLLDKIMDHVPIDLEAAVEKNEIIGGRCHMIFDICLTDSSQEFVKRFVNIFKNNLNLFDPLHGKSFLAKAYEASNTGMLKLLLQHGADPLLADTTFGQSFLEKIIDKNDVDTLQLCLDNAKGLDLNRPYNAYISDSFISRVLQKNPGAAKKMLAYGASKLETKDNEAFFQQALKSDDFDIFKLLIEKGANPMQKPQFGDSIFYALLISKPEWLRVCLDKICPHKDGSHIPSKNVLKAMKNGQLRDESVKLLSEYGVRFDYGENASLIKELFEQGLNKENASFILNSMSHEDKLSLLNSQKYREDFLKQTVDRDNFELFKLFVEEGASPLHKLKYSDSVLYSVMTAKPEWLKYCLDTICPNKDGMHIPEDEVLKAIKNDNLKEESLKLLVDYGAHFANTENMPLIKDIFKNTRNIAILSFIVNGLSSEAKKSLLNSQDYGEDFLKQAVDRDNFEVFKLFIEQGADPLQKPKFGDPVFYTLLTTKPEWLQFCLEKICPEKNGYRIPLKAILKAMNVQKLPSESFQHLKEYGAGNLQSEKSKYVNKVLSFSNNVEYIHFALNTLSTKNKQRLLNSDDDDDDFLQQALIKKNLPLFKLLVEQGADPSHKLEEKSVLSTLLTEKESEFLRVCLHKICPNKDGINIPEDEVLKAIQNNVLTEETYKLLMEYGIHFDDQKNMPIIKDIFKKSTNLSSLSFILTRMSADTKKALLNSTGYDGGFLEQSVKSGDFDRFKLFLDHGADPLQKPLYGDTVFYRLLSHPEWLKVCLDKICPNKDGSNITEDDVLKAIRKDDLTEEAMKLLIKNGIHFDDQKNMPKIKDIFTYTANIANLDFILNGMSPEGKKLLLNSREYGEDFMIRAIERDNFDRFKLFLEHGGDPLLKPEYGDCKLLSKPDWLKYCLEKICPNKDGTNIPVQDLLSIVQSSDPKLDSLLLLREYGMGVGNPEVAAILEQAIQSKQANA